ncbi:MAG: hypothetical protein H0X40_14045 [Chthoniobacterales bacterium]|nr:hypothetical protein [Chthoniobacterales bacterium]
MATLTDDKKIHWQKIEIGRDFGTTLECSPLESENAGRGKSDRSVSGRSEHRREAGELEARRRRGKRERRK